MKIIKQQSQLSGIKIAVIAAVLALAGFLGYTAYTNYKASTQETVSTQAEDVKPAPPISETKDLDEAEATIEQTEIESGNMDDMTELERDMSAF